MVADQNILFEQVREAWRDARSYSSVVTAEQIAFIRESGKAKALNFGSKVDSRNVHQLRWGYLRSLAESDDERTTSIANALIETIRANPSRLLEA